MTFDLTILGSGSALPTTRRYPTAQALNVLERFFLIDCGEGTQLQIRNSKIRLGKLNHIFISHLHGDHIFGLFGLLSTFNLLGRKNDLFIYGHPELETILKFFKQQFAEGLQFSIRLKPLVADSLNPIFEDKAVEAFSFPLKHRVPAFGFLFREKARQPNIRKATIEKYQPGVKEILNIKSGGDLVLGDGTCIPNKELIEPAYRPRSYAFCSDTSYYERIVPWIQDVDLLYHEATFANAELKIARQTGHSTASQAAMIARNAHAGKLILGHFSNRYKDLSVLLSEARAIFPNTFLTEDLIVFKVEQSRTIPES
jgi:ribonuclease Z